MSMVLPENGLKVLSIEDSSNDGELIKTALKKLELPLLFERVVTKEELVKALQKGAWSFVISDFLGSNFNAEDALRIVHELRPGLPFILVCNGIGEETVADMMKAGIEDYVSKFRPDRLVLVVKRILREQEIKVKEANAHKLAQTANAAREQMLAIVSHDIKNPLSAIHLEAQVLLRSASRHDRSLLAEEVKIQANRILKTTDRLKILITDLLDKNKSENGLTVLNREEVDVARLFQEVLDATRPLIHQKGILIRASFSERVTAHLDRNKMFQVLSNLITNAIKFAPSGGTISLGLYDHEHELVFNVSDNGPGLRPQDLSKVFEKYWSGEITGCSGTGLGLFICKTIVEAHGGHIMVENLPEGGAAFSFTVPKISTEKKTSYLENRENRPRIMVIDDDEDLREVISWALGKEGFSVQPFGAPLEAVEYLKKGHNLPSLILADFHMSGMKGNEFLSLKNDVSSLAVRETPVVMISASPLEVEASVPRHFYKEIITKPIDLEALVDKMKTHLH